ncbi:MAG: hypothetical protein Ct9H90mP16_15550 [Candidatus Poseidoniales archaeon]|nr:MAG: hypothetical protein Ct9H90mP16_15550 [Candidatus Poseidoniales archaeon]
MARSEAVSIFDDVVRVGDALRDDWPWSERPRLLMGNPPWLRIKDRFRGHPDGVHSARNWVKNCEIYAKKMVRYDSVHSVEMSTSIVYSWNEVCNWFAQVAVFDLSSPTVCFVSRVVHHCAACSWIHTNGQESGHSLNQLDCLPV